MTVPVATSPDDSGRERDRKSAVPPVRVLLAPETAVAATGAAMIVGMMLLAFANGFGIPVNVSVTVVALATVAASLVPLRLLRAVPIHVADIALLAFIATSLVAVLAAIDRVTLVPTPYVVHTLALLALCPIALLIGRVFGTLASPRWFVRLFAVSLALALVFAAIRLIAPEVVLAGQDDKGSYYQYAGDCLATAGLMAYAVSARRLLGLSLLLALVVLLVLGSRASFAAFAIALLFSRYGLVIALGASSVVGAVAANVGGILDLVPALGDLSRVGTTIAALLTDGPDDASLGERRGFLRLAIDTLQGSPLRGLYAYDFTGNGEMGTFAHNVMDIWAQFGVASFALFLVAVLGAPLSGLVRAYLSPARDPAAPDVRRRSLPLVIFLACELAFFRHPESVLLFFGLGVAAAVAHRGIAPLVDRPRLGRTRA